MQQKTKKIITMQQKTKKIIPEKTKKIIPVFFAADDNYLPYLAVSLHSLKKNASKEYKYNVHILHSGVNEQDAQKIQEFSEEGFISVAFDDVSEKLKSLSHSLQLRDYYTCSTYYRIFIAGMFPDYDKALYLDSDTVVLDDISKLYETDLKDNLIGAVPDGAVGAVEPFKVYTKEVLGIDFEKYFNAGIILMNLKRFREVDFYGKFQDLLQKYRFVVAQDQDYLNVICKDSVCFLPGEWNRMPIAGGDTAPKIVHYNLTMKPWKKDGIKYAEIFWEYAKDTAFFDRIVKEKQSFTPEMEEADKKVEEGLIALSIQEAQRADNYFKKYGNL